MTQSAEENIAILCHEANRAYCKSIGDNSQVSWSEAPEWQKKSAINGVRFHLSNPDAKASASHDSWMHEKILAGWVYGVEKNEMNLTHPCILPYVDLPIEQQIKDHIFRSIVHGMINS